MHARKQPFSGQALCGRLRRSRGISAWAPARAHSASAFGSRRPAISRSMMSRPVPPGTVAAGQEQDLTRISVLAQICDGLRFHPVMPPALAGDDPAVRCETAVSAPFSGVSDRPRQAPLLADAVVPGADGLLVSGKGSSTLRSSSSRS